MSVGAWSVASQRSVRTTVSEDVSFCWDSISPGPRHPDLYKGVSEVFRDGDVDPALAGQV